MPSAVNVLAVCHVSRELVLMAHAGALPVGLAKCAILLPRAISTAPTMARVATDDASVSLGGEAKAVSLKCCVRSTAHHTVTVVLAFVCVPLDGRAPLAT